MCLPGIVAITASEDDLTLADFCNTIDSAHPLHAFPLLVLVDDARFTAASLNNFLWVTFTRSNPAVDIDGVGSFVRDKHFGCTGPLVIDSRIKPHHAPPLVEDTDVTAKVHALLSRLNIN